MSNASKSIQTSLQDIAALLLLLHETYIDEAEGEPAIRQSLLQFVNVIGLSDDVTILVVEKCRRIVIDKQYSVSTDINQSHRSSNSGHNRMGYVLFYAWLREIAIHLHRYNNLDDRKSFHYLLIRYILPFSSKCDDDTDTDDTVDNGTGTSNYNCSKFQLERQSYDIMLKYEEFICLWYVNMIHATIRDINESSDRHICGSSNSSSSSSSSTLRPTNRNQRKYMKYRCKVAQVLESMHVTKISSQLVDVSQIKHMIVCIIDTAVENADYTSLDNAVEENEIDFNQCVLLLQMVAKQIRVDDETEVTADALSVKLTILIKSIADYHFLATIDKFYLHDRNSSSNSMNGDSSTYYDTYDDRNDSETSFNYMSSKHIAASTLALDTSSMLWLLRQGGVICHSFDNSTGGSSTVTLPQLFYSIIACADNTSTDAGTQEMSLFAWSLNTIPVTIAKAIEIQYKSDKSYDTFKRNCTAFNDPTRLLLYIACMKPAVFFANPLKVPVILQHFYSPTSIVYLDNLSIDIASVMKQYQDVNSDGSTIGHRMKLASLLDMCYSNKLIPHVIKKHSVIKAFQFVIGIVDSDSSNGNGSDSSGDSNSDTLENNIEIVETLFVLSQLAFTTLNRALKSIRLSSTEIATAAAAAASVVIIDDYVERFIKFIECLCSSSLMASTFQCLFDNASSNSSSSSSSNKSDNGVVPCTADSVASSRIMMLLTLFPLNQLSLNPMNVSILYNKVCVQRGATSSSDLHAIFTRYCDKYSLSPNDLALFFSKYYENIYNITSTGTNSPSDTNNSRRNFKEEHEAGNTFDTIFFSDECLQLLDTNKHVLLFEYLRYYTKSVSNPAVFTPFGTITDIGTSPVGLDRRWGCCWGLAMGNLDVDEIECVVSEVLKVSNVDYFTFSSFMYFVVRVCTHRLFGSIGISTNGFHVTREVVNRFMAAVKTTLQSIESNLAFIQTMLQFKLLPVLLSSTTPAINTDDKRAVIQCAISVVTCVKQTAEATTLYIAKMNQLLPPQPPPLLFDAPRFLYFCKFIGISAYFASSAVLWQAMGMYLRDNRVLNATSWKASVVPPIPIKATQQALLEVIGNAYKVSVDAGTGNLLLPLDALLIEAVVPVIASYCDQDKIRVDRTNSTSITEQQYLNRHIESILRYGGHSIISTYNNSSRWLNEMLLIIKGDDRGYPHYPTSRVVNLLTCNNLFNKDRLLSIMTDSCHYHRRTGSAESSLDRSNSKSISHPEFEEVLFRYAFYLWQISGSMEDAFTNPLVIVDGYDSNSVGTTDCDCNRNSRVLVGAEVVLVDRYYNECHAITADKASSRYEGSWGVDFIYPYFAVLKESLIQASIAISTNSTSGGTTSSVAAVNSIVAPSSVSHSTNNSKGFFDSATVIARSTELLSDILAGRLEDTAALSSGSASCIPSSPVSATNVATTSSATDHDANANVSLTPSPMDASKELLWPVYATYCSCGDSINPGRLSGPNLFSLMSKLGLLGDQVIFSDVGILMHQISVHIHSSSTGKGSSLSSSSIVFESPSFSFEEFLVFLCAYSQLLFDGAFTVPVLDTDTHGVFAVPAVLKVPNIKMIVESFGAGSILQKWSQIMSTSASFQRLLKEHAVVMLIECELLAFPEDARLRDKYFSLFSLEFLLAIERVEVALKDVFDRSRVSEDETTIITEGLKRLSYIPKYISDEKVDQIVRDIMPKVTAKLAFPQWQYVLFVALFGVTDSNSTVHHLQEMIRVMSTIT